MFIRALAGTLAITLLSLANAAPLSSTRRLAVPSYPQELRTEHTAKNGLPSNDVRTVAVTGNGQIYAGTAKGLARLENESWRPVEGIPAEPVLALVAHTAVAFAATETTIYGVKQDAAIPLATGLPAIPHALHMDTAVPHASDEHVVLLVATDAGIFQCRRGTFSPLPLSGDASEAGVATRDVVVLPNRKTYAAVPDGLFTVLERFAGFGGSANLQPQPWERVLPNEGPTGWSPQDIRALASTPDGHLAFACPQGVGIQTGEDLWQLYTGHEGLPYNDFTSMAIAPDRQLWLGTTKGAIHFDGTHWAYRAGRRWLPNDDVRDIAATEDGAWIATAGGVSHIYFKPMTFAEKATFYEDEIDTYHRRTPFEYVAGVSLENPGDKSKWTQHDTDNDGQYTGLYGAAECFAYGATGDPKAKERATKAFEALAFLSEVTQSGSNPAPHGFIARTILPTDGRNPNEHDSPERDQEKQKGDALWKVIVPRWPTSGDGKWYWKTDASSDELDGHFLMYALYYDLVAETDAEKARVQEVTARVMDHLIDHDFRLVDHDGKPTRWANFNPSAINGNPDWWAERGLNSLSLLTYFNVAWHVTGDQKYRDVFLDLVNNHHYAMNGMVAPKLQAGPGSYVQFDDKMAFMNYYNLIRYESDPKILRMFQNSIFYYWQIVKQERNPFFNFVYAALCLDKGMQTQWGVTDLSPTGPWLEDSVDTLKRFPLDLVMWPVQNSHRIDLIPLPDYAREPGQADGHGYRVDNHVIPIDERNALSFSEDTWRYDDTGGNGKWLDEGSPFLLAYYMGLYHGFITE